MNSALEYTSLSNEELFAKVVEHDNEAFVTLYRRYDRRIYAYCLTITQDQELADDAYQHTFAIMYEKRASFRGGNFEAWLFAIARNHCFRSIKLGKRTTSLDDTHILQAGTVDNRGPNALMQEALSDAIAELPEYMRQPLELRYYGDCSYDEIAKMLDISVSLAKVRVFRAKKKLRKLLSPSLEISG